MSNTTVTRRVNILIPKNMVKRPILWELSQKHNLTYSIRAASLGTDGGIIQIELIGPNTKISNAIADFKNTDVVITDIDDFQLDA